MLQEARTVSKLQHPNIIPIYEVGEHQGKPYLVFEYVDGISLRDLIKKNGTLITYDAIKLMIQILDGIACAHREGVVHRDLSPSNILINKNDVPRIMDFGISIITGDQSNSKQDMAGTLSYMSPEHFSKTPLDSRSDIFALGLIFYEMLVGHPAIDADNHFAAMYKIAYEPILLPSLENPTVDKTLDTIISKAIEKDPDLRYADALDMKKELDEYLAVNESNEIIQSESRHNPTLDFLILRMRNKPDFPTFSHNIIEINQKTSIKEKNSTSASQLANAITMDFALTNKLLRLVNSTFYGNLTEEVTTVSRAVVILGFEQIRHAATSLMFFDHLKSKTQSKELKDATISSLLSGLMAKDIAKLAGMQDMEESFICAILHNLGKHLVIFYFSEEYNQINDLMVKKGLDEKVASRSILGITYEDLGVGVARVWKFPEVIVGSMKSTWKEKGKNPQTDTDMLGCLSYYVNALPFIVCNTLGKERENDLNGLFSRFKENFNIPQSKVISLLESAFEKIKNYSHILNISIEESHFLQQLSCYFDDRQENGLQSPPSAHSDHSDDESDPCTFQIVEKPEISPDNNKSKDHRSFLMRSIKEITQVLLKDYELDDVLPMILETMYLLLLL